MTKPKTPDLGKDGFALEPTGGPIPSGVILELRRLHSGAREASSGLSEAIKAQAEKHTIKGGALRRYIAALEGDKVDAARLEAEDLERLIETGAE